MMEMKLCAECGQMKRIGRSKQKCHACRSKRPPGSLQRPRLTHKERRERRATRLLKTAGKEVLSLNTPWSDYAQYLAGDLWNAIRRFVLLEASHQCVGCAKKATQVHHRSYDKKTMRGRDTSKLVALCATCHRHIEFDEAGNKADLATANKRLDSLIRLQNEF